MTKPSDMEIGEWFEQLHRDHYETLLRNAGIYFRAYGPSAVNRSEDAVQITYERAWKQQEDILEKDSPVAWLCGILKNVVREIYRDDIQWQKQIGAMSEKVMTTSGADFILRTELQDLMTAEEYDLLKRLYICKETYREISEEMGVQKSTLAMRVNRLKKRVAEDYEK